MSEYKKPEKKKTKMNARYALEKLAKQDAPVSESGLTAEQSWDQLVLSGPVEKLEVGYTEPVADAKKACAGCVFMIRGMWNDPDRCELMIGNIEWYGGCKRHVGAVEHAAYELAEIESEKIEQADGDSAKALKLSLGESVSEESWDGSSVRAAMSVEKLRESALAFVGGDPESKSNYKLIYRDESGAINANAVRAIKAALGGARGGVQLPEAIRSEVVSAANKLMDHVAAKMQKSADILFLHSADSAAIDAVEKEFRDTIRKAKLSGVKIEKKDGKDQRLAYGVVLSPDEVDSHGDFATVEDIQKACHDFNEHIRKSGVQHSDFSKKIAVVESYIALDELKMQDVSGSEQTIKKGSWILVTRVDDDQTWDEIKKGKRTGYSFGGFGIRLDS